MNRHLYTGVSVLTLIIITSLILPFFLKYPPDQISLETLSPPNSHHLLGTTDLGEDVFSQLIHGMIPTLFILFGVGIGTSLISFTVGATAVLVGGITDRVTLRVVDIMLSMPTLIVMMLIVSLFKPGIFSLVTFFILFGWHDDVRIFRAKAASEMGMEYILMARTFGAKNAYLITRHLLPECTPLLIARSIQNARKGVFKMTGLAFLGLTDPTMISWGSMLHHSLPYISLDAWKWWMLPPLFLLFATLLSLSLISSYIEHHLFSNQKG